MKNEKRRPGVAGVWELTQYCEEGKRRVLRRIVKEDARFEVTVKTDQTEAALGEKIEAAIIRILDDLEETDEKTALWKKAEAECPAMQEQ